jgi:hypothetical protein
MEAARPKGARDVTLTGALDHVPRRERGTQLRPRREAARKIRLEAEDDVDRFVEGIGLIAEVRLGSAVRGFQNGIDMGESVCGPAPQG